MNLDAEAARIAGTASPMTEYGWRRTGTLALAERSIDFGVVDEHVLHALSRSISQTRRLFSQDLVQELWINHERLSL